MKIKLIKILIGIVVLIIIFLSLILLIAKFRVHDCLHSDAFTRLKSLQINGKEHSIYLRKSGFHEKEYFYELHQGLPKLDSCGDPVSKLISTTHIEFRDKSISKLVIENQKVKIIYAEGSGQQPGSYRDVAIEIKPPPNE